MSAITVRPFRRSDRDQLTDLVNGHAHAVMPGVSITVNAVLSQLEHEPDEFIVDPWVQERATLVAEQRGRITAAAHMVRYADHSGVGPDLRGTGELRWLLQWPDASYWPDAHLAGRSVADAALIVMRSWSVQAVLADFTLPAPGLTGVAEQWPHIGQLVDGLGFVSRRSEQVLLADVSDLPADVREDLTILRTLGECGTRFTALADRQEVGYVEIDTTMRLIQAPSGKCVEDESDDCRDCRFKCGVGPPVVCVENFPRFDMGDDSFDGGACVVEALVECFLPVEKFPAGWFFERGEHAAPDVSFIADRGVCGEVVEGAGLVEAI